MLESDTELVLSSGERDSETDLLVASADSAARAFEDAGGWPTAQLSPSSGSPLIRRRLFDMGLPAHYYHRPLKAYLDAFVDAGLKLRKLVDVPDRLGLPWPNYRFPRFMVLAFEKE